MTSTFIAGILSALIFPCEKYDMCVCPQVINHSNDTAISIARELDNVAFVEGMIYPSEHRIKCDWLEREMHKAGLSTQEK